MVLVGAGQMGSRHARVLAQSPDCRLVRLVDPVEAVGRPVAERYGVAWAPELDDLRGVDAVVVAAATPAHHDVAGRVLDLGLPLLVEKPLATTLAQSEDLVRRAAAADVPLMCGLLERFNPAVRTAREIVGDVVQVTALRHSPFVPRITTGVATDLLIHDVDLTLRLLAADPTSVKAQFGYFHDTSLAAHAEDCADVTLGFASGAVATISASRVSQHKVRQLSIMELDRLVEVDLLRNDVTVYHHVEHSLPHDGGGGFRQQTVIEIPSMPYSQEPLAAQLAHFLGLLGGAGDVVAERESILPAHRVVDRATTSAATDS